MSRSKGNADPPSKLGRSPWKRLLGIDLRGWEKGPALLLFLYALVLFTCFYAAKVIRQLHFVDELGAEKLPYVYLLGALISYPILRGYTRLVDRLKRHYLLSVTVGIMALGMVVFRYTLSYGPLLTLAFYIWMGLVFAIAVSQFWSYANQIFDPSQAKRLFSFIAVGCGIGGILGGQFASFITRIMDAESALLAVAALHLPLIILIHWCEKLTSHIERPAEKVLPAATETNGKGLRLVFGSRYLRLIAAGTMLSILAAQVVDFMFSWAIQEFTPDSGRRAELFGHLYSLTSLAALAVQV
ncbi:MAG: hypothetical protein MI867_26470, partial [Pseudomonadales bacterium]|nr:hypothetical protein [Pseudomonadales bacterium]